MCHVLRSQELFVRRGPYGRARKPRPDPPVRGEPRLTPFRRPFHWAQTRSASDAPLVAVFIFLEQFDAAARCQCVEWPSHRGRLHQAKPEKRSGPNVLGATRLSRHDRLGALSEGRRTCLATVRRRYERPTPTHGRTTWHNKTAGGSPHPEEKNLSRGKKPLPQNLLLRCCR
jgi:hypothetical protein